tara:strand:- start:81 stop:428 length:348 start_codon:yes stop_codon:yes gene_type:complete
MPNYTQITTLEHVIAVWYSCPEKLQGTLSLKSNCGFRTNGKYLMIKNELIGTTNQNRQKVVFCTSAKNKIQLGSIFAYIYTQTDLNHSMIKLVISQDEKEQCNAALVELFDTQGV